MLERLISTPRATRTVVLHSKLEQYFNVFPKPTASSLNQGLKIDWQLKLLYERIASPALKDIINIISDNNECHHLNEASWVLLFLLCNKNIIIPTHIEFFSSFNSFESNDISKFFLIHKNLNANITNVESTIFGAFKALQNIFYDAVLSITLFKTFIAPILRDHPQYLGFSANIIIKQHPALLNSYCQFISGMPAADPFVIDALADIALYMAHSWYFMIDTSSVNKEKKDIAKNIRENFEESVSQTFIFARKRCTTYITEVIQKQGDSGSVRARAKHDFLENYILERHESIETNSKILQARMIQKKLHQYLITPGVINRIVEKNPLIFATDMTRILEWHNVTFFDAVFDGLLNYTGGVRNFSNVTVDWLFTLPDFKKLNFIVFEQDNEGVARPNSLTVSLLEDIFGLNDVRVMNAVFLANQTLGAENRTYPLFSALTRVNNYGVLGAAVGRILQDPNFHIMHYFDYSSDAFKAFPGVNAAMILAYAEALNESPRRRHEMYFGG